MSSYKKVSVCLPVFNGGQFLGEAIDSILNQSYEDLELLIGDDGSSDQTAEIALKYAQADKRVIYWRNPCQLGLYGNYNNCLVRASGEYIKPFVQEDILETDAIAKLVHALDKHTSATLVCGARRIISHDDDKNCAEPGSLSSGIVSGAEVTKAYLSSFENRIGTPSQVMFRKRDKADGFDSAYSSYGDIDFWLRLLLMGDLVSIPEVVCNLRRPPESFANSGLRESSIMADVFRLADKYMSQNAEAHSKSPYYAALGRLVASVSKAMEKNDIDLFIAPEGEDDKSFVLSSFVRSSNYDFKKIAEQTLLYAAVIKSELDDLKQQSSKRNSESERQAEDWSRRVAELSAELDAIKKSRTWKWTLLYRKLRAVVAR